MIARNINAAITIRRWYEKFRTGDESLTNEDHGKQETVVHNKVLQAIMETNPGKRLRRRTIRNSCNDFLSLKIDWVRQKNGQVVSTRIEWK